LKQVWQEAALAVGGADRRRIGGGGGRALGVARCCGRCGGREAHCFVEAGVDAVAAAEADRWSHGHTPSGTSGCTSGWSCHSLPLLCFLVGADCIICNDDISDKFWK
jgi:hypothetical protein